MHRAVALKRPGALPQGQKGSGFLISDRGVAGVFDRQGFQHFTAKGRNGNRLLTLHQGLKNAQGRAGGLIEILARQEVAHRLDSIAQGVAFVLDTPEPVTAGAPVSLG